MNPDHSDRTSEELPGGDVLARVSREFGLDATDAQLLHHRSNAVYLLPHEQVVARLAPATRLRRERATTTIAVTRWLATQPSPIALAPIAGDQPVITESAVATFWPYRPPTPPPALHNLAQPLRHLHGLLPPPFPVPVYRPLHRLYEALTIDSGRRQPTLTIEEHIWLTRRARRLVDRFVETRYPLGNGLVHADAHRDNLLRDGDHWVLIDWDQACLGPRELDLLAGLPDHFHEPDETRTAFLTAYGYDLTHWPHWPLLRDIAELHSLASYIRLAPDKPAAAEELMKRMDSLRSNDRFVRWQAIS